jgi:hypothetical protein
MKLVHKPSLPVELLQTIFEEVRKSNEEDLLNVRLANRYFCTIVTPYVFQTIRVQDTVESTNALCSILESPHLVQEIREVCIIQDKICGESRCIQECSLRNNFACF